MTNILNKLVYIEWTDHCSSGEAGWVDKKILEELTPAIIKTVGWVFKETEDFITLVSSTATDEDDETYGGDTLILKNCIRFQKEIKEI